MTNDQLLAARAMKLATYLLDIARGVMPDTYFQSDSRCEYARETIELLKKNKQRRKNHGS